MVFAVVVVIAQNRRPRASVGEDRVHDIEQLFFGEGRQEVCASVGSLIVHCQFQGHRHKVCAASFRGAVNPLAERRLKVVRHALVQHLSWREPRITRRQLLKRHAAERTEHLSHLTNGFWDTDTGSADLPRTVRPACLTAHARAADVR